jgi:hypothetical protein
MKNKKPREKALELIDKFVNFECDDGYDLFQSSISIIEAKQCALFCVDEILNAVTTIADKKYDYWQEVKKQIELL